MSFSAHQGRTPDRGRWAEPLRWGLAPLGEHLLFVGGFWAVLLLLAKIDVYNQHFYERSSLYLLYNILRLVFVFYYACLMYAIGWWLAKAVGTLSFDGTLAVAERVVLLSLLGASVANGLIFLAGLLQLLYYAVFVVLVSLGLLFGYHPVRALARDAAERVREAYRNQMPFFRGLLALQLGLASFCAVAVVVPCLAPFTSDDVLEHYHKYLLNVIQNHHIWPNLYWEHFYISKGTGLQMLGALLTDIHMPLLISLYMFGLITLLIFSLVSRRTGSPFWGLTICLLYVAFFTSTFDADGPSLGLERQGFERHHIVTAAFVAGIFWMGTLFPEVPNRGKGKWVMLWSVMMAGLALWAPTALVIVVPALLFTALIYVCMHRDGQGKRMLVVPLRGAAVWAVLVAVNYWTTGLAESTPFRICWRFADLSKVSRLVDPYWVMFYYIEGVAPHSGWVDLSRIGLTVSDAYLGYVLRWYHVRLLSDCLFMGVSPSLAVRHLLSLRIVLPTVLLIGIAIYVAARWGALRAPSAEGWSTKGFFYGLLVALAFFLAACVVSPCAGSLDSVRRYYVFIVLFEVVFAMHVVQLLVRIASKEVAVVSAVLGALLIVATDIRPPRATMDFALGRESFQQFYQRLGILPPYAQQILSRVRPGAIVWNLTHQRLVGPGVRVEVENELPTTLRHWHKVVFEQPRIAAEELKRHEVDFFLVDVAEVPTCALGFSPLFGRESLKEHFRTVWHRRSLYLLTWKQRKQEPGIPDSDLRAWKRAIDIEQPPQQRLYKQVQRIYRDNDRRVYPIVRDPNLPWIGTWDK